ncbi:MAG: hypothetical protein ACKVVP_18305 [Chloroflexota bacterium]
MNSVEIRHCSPGDESLFDQIADEVFDSPIDRSKLASFLTMPEQHLLPTE